MFDVLKHCSNKIQHTDGPEPVSALSYWPAVGEVIYQQLHNKELVYICEEKVKNNYITAECTFTQWNV